MAALKSAYLIFGTDEGKVASARKRLRQRAEGEGGSGALETFAPSGGAKAPDADELLASLASFSLLAGRRYLIVDGPEGWTKADLERVAGALGDLPEETTIAFFCPGKPPAALTKAVQAAGGEVLSYEAPRERDMPKQLVADAAERGLKLELAAARMLVDRMGPRPMRLRTELDRLAVWARGEGDDGLQVPITVEDLTAMISDTSEEAIWTLADAIVAGDEATTLLAAERLVSQGEPLPKMIYTLGPRLRQGLAVARELEAGRSAKQVADGLKMHPYAAKMLVGRVAERTPADLARAIEALADLELWSRGGSDYDEAVATTLSLRRAAGGGEREEGLPAAA